jgi:hypothetical protein
VVAQNSSRRDSVLGEIRFCLSLMDAAVTT